MQADFLKISKQRGLLQDVTDIESLDKELCAGPITAYLGFDATADSLHVGNLVQLMRLRLLQQTGHKVIALLGGGTTLIGDPSDKDQARPLLAKETVEHNIQAISKTIKRFLGDDVLIVNNYEWLKEINYLEFLRDFGPHFSINRMISFESVKLRLEREQSLSFLEFNYMLLQAYDFLHLNKNYSCNLQLGGSDQWGNIVSGVDLVRRVSGKTVYGCTAPLLATSSGAKMGKTVKGAIWLDAEKLSPYDYWQFWRNSADSDIKNCFLWFTELPIAEIERLTSLQGAELNQSKIVLANEATKLLHGENMLEEIWQKTKSLFEDDSRITPDYTINEMSVVDFVHQNQLAESKSAARRLLSGDGLKLNGEKLSDDVSLPIGIHKLSIGKKKHYWIKVI